MQQIKNANLIVIQLAKLVRKNLLILPNKNVYPVKILFLIYIMAIA